MAQPRSMERLTGNSISSLNKDMFVNQAHQKNRMRKLRRTQNDQNTFTCYRAARFLTVGLRMLLCLVVECNLSTECLVDFIYLRPVAHNLRLNILRHEIGGTSGDRCCGGYSNFG